jgi:hypothetical protein
MSALDDLIARDAAVPQAATLDSLIARDSAPVPASAAGGTGAAPVQTAAGQPTWKVPGGFMMGIGDAAAGTAQGIVHGLAWAANKIAPDSEFAKGANDSLPQMQAALDQHNQAYAAQRAANGSSGFDPARIAGNIVGTAPTMALGPEYAGLGLGGRVALGAAQSAAAGGMMPTSAPTPDNSYAQQKLTQMGVAGALGAAAPLATAGATAVGRGIWAAAQPVIQPGQFVGHGLASAMDPAEAATAAANIRGAPQFVPGSMPTTAQVAQTPVMVQTEKAAGNIPGFKTALAQRMIDNNDARWQSLMGVAQDPAALQAAETARSAAATPLYNTAHQATANVGPAFMRFAQIPEMQEAMQRADGLASLNSATGRGVAPVWPQPPTPGVAGSGSRTINGAALDYTSRALGDMIGEAANQPSRAGALRALQQRVDNWTQSYIPGVQQADAAYAAGSVPINTMEVGQQIANGLGTRAMNAGGAPEIQMMPYRSALTRAMGTGDAARYGIDANALTSLQGIGQDLQRGTVSNSIKSPGSDTAYNLQANGWLANQIYGPTFNGAGNVGRAVGAAGAMLMGHPMVGLGILGGGNRIGQVVGGRLQNHLSNYLLNPDTVLPYLDAHAATAAGQAGPSATMQGLLNYGRPAVLNGLLGGLINAPQ